MLHKPPGSDARRWQHGWQASASPLYAQSEKMLAARIVEMPGCNCPFDSPPPQKQLDYWMKNVNPYIKEQGNMETWRYDPELSYNGRGENAPPSNFARQRFSHVKPGMWGKYMELRTLL